MLTITDLRVPLGVAMLSTVLGLCAPAAADAEPFSGIYAGGDFGFESAGRTDKNGWTYGGFLGVNVRLGDRLFVGAEARLADSTISETIRRETTTQVTVVENAVGRSIGGTARIGWLAGPRTALFARAGYEQVKFNAVQTRTPKPPTTNPNPVVADFGFNDDTLILGGGVEHFVTDRLSLRATYDWAENFDRHQLRVGVAFNF